MKLPYVINRCKDIYKKFIVDDVKYIVNMFKYGEYDSDNDGNSPRVLLPGPDVPRIFEDGHYTLTLDGWAPNRKCYLFELDHNDIPWDEYFNEGV